MDVRELEKSLQSHLHMEVGRIEKLQTDNDRQRKLADEQKSLHQQKLLETILQGQIDDLEERQKNRRFIMRYIIAPAAGILTVVGGATGYLQTTKEKPTEIKQEIHESSAAMESQISTLEQRLRQHDRIHERMIQISLDQQVELTDSVEFLGKKIDRISSRATSVPVPPSVQEGQRKTDAIKQSRGDLPEYDPANPLSDLIAP